MSTYLARIEHVNEFYNIRPVMELLDDGFVEVDGLKFGQYGTITIAAIYGQYSESPLIQDGKYVMFKLDDNELASLEKTYNGYRIKASDYITRVKALDTYRIREVIDIPTEYNFETYYEWKKEMITDIMPPITSVVYLSNESQIIGPFCWKELSGNGYQFLPYAEGEDAYVVNVYNINDFEEPIYEFDAAKRPSDLYYEAPVRSNSFMPSIESPTTFIRRPLICVPIGMVMGPPSGCTFIPLCRPSVLSIATVRTVFSPMCCCTSTISLLPFDLFISSAS